jgi:hypothetical protein
MTDLRRIYGTVLNPEDGGEGENDRAGIELVVSRIS